MSSKRKWRRRQCGHKVRHETVGNALGHMSELIRKDGATMGIYKCRWCGSYHVGHRG